MSYIYVSEKSIVYPFELKFLLESFPNVSFSDNLTSEDLSPFGIFLVEETEKPPFDSRTQKIDEGIPECDETGIWKKTWTVRDATTEEIAAYDVEHLPPPNWKLFRRIALNSDSLSNVLVEGFKIRPQAVLQITSGLDDLENGGDASKFLSAWSILSGIVKIPPEDIATFSIVAQRCNLPERFIQAFSVGS
jgi:hypothetical protein